MTNRKTAKTATRRSQLRRSEVPEPNPDGNRAERRAAKRAQRKDRGEGGS